MLSTRLKKLEKDLSLISTIQNILTSDDDGNIMRNLNLNLHCVQEVPERDIPSRPSIPTVAGVGASRSDNKLRTAISRHNKNIRKDVSSLSTNIKTGGVAGAAVGVGSVDPTGSVGDDETLLLEKVEVERRRRIEVQESAARVALKLQKTEDDLDRERNTKKSLLIGTLEMKNKLQSFENVIPNLQAQITTKQEEMQKMSIRLEEVAQEKLKIEIDFKSKLETLEKDNIVLETKNKDLEEESLHLQRKCACLAEECQRNEESGNLQGQRWEAQLAELKSRFLDMEKEKLEIAHQLHLSVSKYENLKKESESAISDHQSLQSSVSSQLLEKESEMLRLESEHRGWQLEKADLKSQISSATNLIFKTKSLISSLQRKRDAARKKLNPLQRQIHTLSGRNKKLTCKGKVLKEELSGLKERISGLLRNDFEKSRISDKERERLEMELKSLVLENEGIKTEFDLIKGQNEAEKVNLQQEIVTLKSEVRRVTDNLSVLQKICEEEGRRSGKEREELKACRKDKESVEVELRDVLQNEARLSRELWKEQESSLQVQAQLKTVQEELEAMKLDLRDHDCDQFVESKCKSRVHELEIQIKSQLASWQRSNRSLEGQRDLALTAARKALKQTEDLRDSSQRQIIKIKSTTNQRVRRIEEEKFEILRNNSNKVQSLESEVARLKQCCGQMQRGYGTKIQQLQTALNACLGHSNPPFTPFGDFSPDLGNAGNIGPF